METVSNPSYEYFFVARQPIFDQHKNTFGYELLFRAGAQQTIADITDADQATINVVTCGFSKSQENISQTKRIFINFTENLILSGAPRALPPSVTVVEILEDILPSPAMFAELLKLKQEGYMIAVDDFVGNSPDDSFLDLADIIKVDVLHKSEAEIAAIYQQVKDKKAVKLAEKVESQSAFNFLLKMGFQLFQGYFFARPENLTGKKVSSSQMSKIRVLAALNRPDLEIEAIVNLVNGDPSLAYRLLRLLNSAAFSFSMKIESILHAVVLLGISRVKYWLRMVVLSDLNTANNPGELLLLALTRGKVLEELAVEGCLPKHKPETMFLFGMLSLLDVMLDMPFPRIFTKLPLPQDFCDGYTNPRSELAMVLSILPALENDDISLLCRSCQTLNINQQDVASAAIRANAWTDLIANEIL